MSDKPIRRYDYVSAYPKILIRRYSWRRWALYLGASISTLAVCTLIERRAGHMWFTSIGIAVASYAGGACIAALIRYWP